jgi:hypothetical protein
MVNINCKMQQQKIKALQAGKIKNANEKIL